MDWGAVRTKNAHRGGGGAGRESVQGAVVWGGSRKGSNDFMTPLHLLITILDFWMRRGRGGKEGGKEDERRGAKHVNAG